VRGRILEEVLTGENQNKRAHCSSWAKERSDHGEGDGGEEEETAVQDASHRGRHSLREHKISPPLHGRELGVGTWDCAGDAGRWGMSSGQLLGL
jgi:hypothetical protein